MEIKLKSLSIVGLVALAGFSASAMGATQSNRTLTGVGCDSGGVCFANVTPAVVTSCTNPNQVRWDGSTSSGKNFTASALTANASGATVNIGTVDGVCNGSFARVNFITVRSQ